jgi:hypothetical protein
MNNLNDFIDISIINPTRREKFRECMKYHNELFIIVRQQHDITNDDIDKFQLLADSFYKTWIEIADREGITNYIHIIGSGHIAEFMRLS